MCSSFVPASRPRLTYGESSDLLEDVGEDLLEEFERDFLARNRRQVVAEIGDLVVVDFHGESEDGSARRVLISKQAPWLAQSEASVAPDGSVDLNRVPQRVQQALIVPWLSLPRGRREFEELHRPDRGRGPRRPRRSRCGCPTPGWRPGTDERAPRLAADHFGVARRVRPAGEGCRGDRGRGEVGSRAAILLTSAGP